MATTSILYTNLIRSTPATLTASEGATGYEATYLYTGNYSEVWRSTTEGLTEITIVADFGAPVTVDSVALGNVNFRSSATIKIQGHTADVWTSPDVDETIDVSDLDGEKRCVFHTFASASKQYWRLSLLDDSGSGNPDGFLEIGEWFLGVKTDFTDKYDASSRTSVIRNNVQLETEYNQVYTYKKDYARAFNLNFTNIQQSMIDILEALDLAVYGNAEPFFFVIDSSTAPHEVYFVRWDSNFEYNRINYDRYSSRVVFVEEFPGINAPR